jgi:hypothetical protein
VSDRSGVTVHDVALDLDVRPTNAGVRVSFCNANRMHVVHSGGVEMVTVPNVRCGRQKLRSCAAHQCRRQWVHGRTAMCVTAV